MGLRASHPVLLRATFRRARFCLFALVLCVACHRADKDTPADDVTGDSILDITDTTELDEQGEEETSPTCEMVELYRVDVDWARDGITESTDRYERIQVTRDAEDRVSGVVTTVYDANLRLEDVDYFAVDYDGLGRVAAVAETSPESEIVSGSDSNWNRTFIHQVDSLFSYGTNDCGLRLRFAYPGDVTSIEVGTYVDTDFAAEDTIPVTTTVVDSLVVEMQVLYSQAQTGAVAECDFEFDPHEDIVLQFGYEHDGRLEFSSISGELGGDPFFMNTIYATNALTYEQLYFYGFPNLGRTRQELDWGNTRLAVTSMPAAAYCVPY